MVEAYHGQDKISNFVQGIAGGRVADALGPKLGHVDLRCAIVNQKVDAGLVVNEKHILASPGCPEPQERLCGESFTSPARARSNLRVAFEISSQPDY
eukprot:g67251.t1